MLKIVNFEALTENFSDTEEIANKQDKILYEIETNKNYLSEYFVHVNQYHDVIFQSEKEEEIITLLNEKLNFSLSTLGMDYGQYLYEMTDIDELKFGIIGEGITITDEQIYTSLWEEFLSEKDIEDRLIKANDFENELKKIKKEVIRYLFDLTVDDARISLEQYLSKE